MDAWKDITAVGGEYEVSSSGLVRNQKGHILQSFLNADGYRKVRLFVNGKPKAYRVARLVALAFLPNPDAKPFVDHINRNRADDRATNLRWASLQENARNAIFKRGTSQYRGVNKRTNKATKLWEARISVNGRNLFIGYFDTEREAALAYNDMAKRSHKEFAILNEVY